MLGRSTQRRLVIAGLAATFAAPVAVIEPAAAAITFTCDSVTGSAVFSPGLVHDPSAQSLSSGPTAPAGPQEVVLASTSDAGAKANAGTALGSLSADGTKVAFSSSATNLDPGDTDAVGDIYVKDLTTGEVVLASTSGTGVKSNENSYEPAVSDDGTHVAFWSWATNLDPADTDDEQDVYVKDLTTGNITLASTSDTGVKGNDYSAFFVQSHTLSADGSKVAFVSGATNLDPADTDSGGDVYVKDLTTGNITLASTSDTGVKSNADGSTPSLSADGTKVAFYSSATNLDPGDTDSVGDVYVKDLTTGDVTLSSTSDTGVKGNRESYPPSLSADGTRVAFVTQSNNLDSADTDFLWDVYVKDLSTGDITLATTSDAGVKGKEPYLSLPVSLSADGTKVAFGSSAKQLDPADTFRNPDIYVKDITTGDITLVSTSDRGVKGNGGSSSPSLLPDGTKVAFASSATNLDPVDTDSAPDVYVKELPAVPTSIDITDCSNGNSGTASVVDIRSYGPRPLGCPVSLGGAAGNDYADTTPILVGATLSMTIDWATGPNSYGVAAAKAGLTGTQWRFRLAITSSPGHDTPATNQYLPAAGGGLTKTRLQGKFDVSALDGFNCTSGSVDPLSWLSLANNGTWVAKTS